MGEVYGTMYSISVNRARIQRFYSGKEIANHDFWSID